MDKPKEGDWIVSNGSGTAYSVRAAFPQRERPFYQIEVEGLLLNVFDEEFEQGPQGQPSTYNVLPRPPYEAIYVRDGVSHRLRLLGEDEPIPALGSVVVFSFQGQSTLAEVVEILPATFGFIGQVVMLATTPAA